MGTFPEHPLAPLVGAASAVTGLFGSHFAVFSVAFYRTLDGPAGTGGSSSARRAAARGERGRPTPIVILR